MEKNWDLINEHSRETAGRDGGGRRRNPRVHTRSLVADISLNDTDGALHGVSENVSPFGASFVITGNPEGVKKLKVGDQVTVRTPLAHALRAEVNSIRSVSATDARPLIGIKLLDGKRWMDDNFFDPSLLESV